LKHEYRYDANPLSQTIRVESDGEVLRRSIVGSQSDFKKAEADKFLKKLAGMKSRQSTQILRENSDRKVLFAQPLSKRTETLSEKPPAQGSKTTRRTVSLKMHSQIQIDSLLD